MAGSRSVGNNPVRPQASLPVPEAGQPGTPEAPPQDAAAVLHLPRPQAEDGRPGDPLPLSEATPEGVRGARKRKADDQLTPEVAAAGPGVQAKVFHSADLACHIMGFLDRDDRVNLMLMSAALNRTHPDLAQAITRLLHAFKLVEPLTGMSDEPLERWYGTFRRDPVGDERRVVKEQTLVAADAVFRIATYTLRPPLAASAPAFRALHEALEAGQAGTVRVGIRAILALGDKRPDPSGAVCRLTGQPLLKESIIPRDKIGDMLCLMLPDLLQMPFTEGGQAQALAALVEEVLRSPMGDARKQIFIGTRIGSADRGTTIVDAYVNRQPMAAAGLLGGLCGSGWTGIDATLASLDRDRHGSLSQAVLITDELARAGVHGPSSAMARPVLATLAARTIPRDDPQAELRFAAGVACVAAIARQPREGDVPLLVNLVQRARQDGHRETVAAILLGLHESGAEPATDMASMTQSQIATAHPDLGPWLLEDAQWDPKILQRLLPALDRPV